MERSEKVWTNLVICKVEDPQTVWLKEIPSPSMTASMRNFQEMEVQMNEYYNFRKRKRLQKVPVIGEVVAVRQRDHWYRAKVKKVVKTNWSLQVSVFLLDHGKSVDVQIENVVEMKPGEWTSVEYQAFRVQLLGLIPISLKYSKEMKVVFRKVGSWDPSAYDYAKKLFSKYKQADFLPLKSGDIVQGFLFIRTSASPEEDLLPASVFDAQPCSPLQDALPEESAFFERTWGKEGPRLINVMHVLVALGYATIDTETFVKFEQEIRDWKVLSVPKFPFSFHKREEYTQKPKELTFEPECESYSELTVMESETVVSRKTSQMTSSTFEYPALSNFEGSYSCEKLDENVHERNSGQLNPSFSTCNTGVSFGSSSSLQRDESSLEINSRESSPCLDKNSSSMSTSEMLLLIKKQRNENKSRQSLNYDSEVSEVEVSEVSNTSAKDNYISNDRSSGNICSASDLFDISVPKKKDEEVTLGDISQQNFNGWDAVAIPAPAKEGQEQNSCDLSNDTNQVVDSVEFSPFMKLTSSSKQPLNFMAAEHCGGSFRRVKNLMFNKPLQEEEGEVIQSSVGAAVDAEHCSDSSGLCKDEMFNRGRCFPSRDGQFLSCKNLKRRKASSFSHEKPHEQVLNIVHEKEKGNIAPEFRIQSFTVPSEGIVLQGIGSCFPKQNKLIDLYEKKDDLLKDGTPSLVSKVIDPEGKAQFSKYLFPMMACKWDREESSNVKEEEKSVVGTKTYIDCMNIKKEYELPLLARLNRVFVAGDDAIGEEEVITNVDMSRAVLNSHVGKMVSRADLYVSRIQSYLWAALTKGISAIVVGGRRSGKTFGYLVPLISSLSDTASLITKRLPAGIGAMMIIICGTWRQVKEVGNHISVLLPPTGFLKCVTAWGGQGHEEQDLVKKQLLNGCDILVSTLPFLMKVLNNNTNSEVEGMCTTLNRCCYLVIDDAETVIENEPGNIKTLLELLGQGRAKRKRLDDVQQIVVVGSQWTKLLDDLTCTLAPLSPTIFISSPQEAAIAARVSTKVHFIHNEKMVFSEILCLIHEEDGHILIFLRNEEMVAQLQEVLEGAAVHTVSIEMVPSTWELRRQIDMWRTSVSCSMLIPESAVPYLLLQDLRDASVIIHQYIPETSKGLFAARYSFMMDRFSTVIGQKSVCCKSHILLTKETITRNAAVVKELKRMKAYIPQDVEKIASGIAGDERKSELSLCHFLKSYGVCKEQQCKWRHEVLLSDQPLHIPQEGDVEFELVEVINASCYLVRLINYRKSASHSFTSLKSFYLNLFLAMQQFFSIQENQKVVTSPEVGRVCAICHEAIWTRAKILHINYAADVMKVHLFLLDDGLELRKNIQEIFKLPEYLAAMPQLIVEVHLCCVRPLDNDREWTHNASQYVRKLFSAPQTGPAKRFVGKVALAIGHVLWLGPIVEMVQKRNTYLKLKAVRNQLLTEGYGQINGFHLKMLEAACEKADWKVKRDLSGGDFWLETYREADERIRFEMGLVSSRETENKKALQAGPACTTTIDDLTDILVNSEETPLRDGFILKVREEKSITDEHSTVAEETSITNECSADTGKETNITDGFDTDVDKMSTTNEFSTEIGVVKAGSSEFNTKICKMSSTNELDSEIGEETSSSNEFNTEISKEISSTIAFSSGIGEETYSSNKFNTEIDKEISNLNEFSSNIGKETSSSNEFDTEIGKETCRSDEFSAEIGEEISTTGEFDPERVKETSSTNEHNTEIGVEESGSNKFNTEMGEETSSTDELSSESGEETTVTDEFTGEIDEEKLSITEFNREIGEKTCNSNEFNAEVSGMPFTNELNTETGVQVGEKASYVIKEVGLQNPAENLGSENIDIKKPEELGTGRVGAMDSSRLKLEFLTVNEELTVEVTEVVTPQCFFVIKEEMFEKLDSLEDSIHELTTDWGRGCHNASNKVLMQPSNDAPLGSVCLAQFNDDEFYRALVLEENHEAKERLVFFIDHGEKMWISEKKVYECPADLVDALPAQAIQCRLAPGQEESALHFDSEEVNLNNGGQICTIKVLAKEELQDPVYVVEVYQRMPILLSDDANKQGTLMECGRNDPSSGNERAMESCDAMASELDEISITDAVNFLSGLVGLKNFSKDVSKSFERITEINDEDVCVSTSLDRRRSASEQLDNKTDSFITEHNADAEEALVTTTGSGQSLEKIACNEGICKATEVTQELSQIQIGAENPKELKSELLIKGSCSSATQIKLTENKESVSSCESEDSENHRGKFIELELGELPDGDLQENKELNNVLLKSEKIGNVIINTHSSENFHQEGQTVTAMEKSKEIRHVEETTNEGGQDLKKSTCVWKTETETEFESGKVSEMIATQRVAPLDWSGPSLQAVEAVTPKLKPMTTWYQNISRVVLRLDLSRVSLYQCRFSSTHILFRTVLADRYYEMNEHLHGILNPDLSSVEIHPAHVLIIIIKQHEGLWSRLLHGRDKVPWLNVDWSMVEVLSSSDEEEELGNLAAFVGETNSSLKGGRPAGVSDEDGSSSESYDSDDSDVNLHIS